MTFSSSACMVYVPPSFLVHFVYLTSGMFAFYPFILSWSILNTTVSQVNMTFSWSYWGCDLLVYSGAGMYDSCVCVYLTCWLTLVFLSSQRPSLSSALVFLHMDVLVKSLSTSLLFLDKICMWSMLSVQEHRPQSWFRTGSERSPRTHSSTHYSPRCIIGNVQSTRTHSVYPHLLRSTKLKGQSNV